MILQLVRAQRKQILIDIDTQKDFLLAGGKACIGNHRRVLAHIRRVMAWARYRNVPIISTADLELGLFLRAPKLAKVHDPGVLQIVAHIDRNFLTGGSHSLHYV